MSKVICDVCGTSFPESATQCPICGCVRSGESVVVDTEKELRDTSDVQTYTYVKGGKFSKANVKKRNQGIMPEVRRTTTNPKGDRADDKGDRGLVVAICTLLLAIVAVVIYIVVNFFSVSDKDIQGPNEIVNPDVTQSAQQTEQTPVDTKVPCVSLVLSQEEVKFTTVGSVCELSVEKTPADTTDELIFTSENDLVATVSADGKITAVAEGETNIIVQCGDVTAQCRVTCQVETIVETTEPLQQYKEPYRINKTDVSIDPDEVFQLKLLDANNEIIPVEWTVGNTDVCTVTGNSVTGAASGSTWISVVFDGTEYKCRVIVRKK